MEFKKGDIVVYETDDVNWLIQFHSWYEPYEGHMHYHFLYDCDDKESYGPGTCCLLEPDCLRKANDSECQLLFDKMKEYDDKKKEDIEEIERKKKETVIHNLIDEYNKWYTVESENVKSGKGMRGSNGHLSGFSFDELFNEIAWRLYTGVK